MHSEYQLDGSYRPRLTSTTIVDNVEPTEPVTLTVHLENPSPEPEAERFESVTSNPRSALAAKNIAEFSPAVPIFAHFADRYGLSMVPDPECRCVYLKGPSARLCELFGTTLNIHHDGHQRFRARSGFLSLPSEIAPWTRAVLGFDERPVVKRPFKSLSATTAGPGMWPTEIALLYGIPKEMDAKGECIGIIAVGGAYRDDDLSTAKTNMSRPLPLVVPYYVHGLSNSFSGSVADKELALDLQVLAGVAPLARIVVYFTDNKERDFGDAVNAALRDGANQPHVLSISWGAVEGIGLSVGCCKAIDSNLRTAGKYGVTVIAAAGDKLATAGETDNHAHVLFPASSPSVLACGGTNFKFAADANTFVDETVWNDGLSGTGGGISDIFPVPEYQRSVSLPPSSNVGRTGRGLPDVAAAASTSPAYKIVFNGNIEVEYGTSAATPLWAALIAIANTKRGRPLGSIHNFLYQNPELFREITDGNNRLDGIGYYAAPLWNACTGLGVPKGAVTVQALVEVP